MRSAWLGAATGISSTSTRPLDVSITSRFSGAMARQSDAAGAVCATAGAWAAPAARRAATVAAMMALRMVLSTLTVLDLGPHALGDGGADETVDRAVQSSDLLDEARGDRLMARIGHQEYGLDVLIEALVHGRHLELVFKVGDGAQTPDDDAGVQLFGEMHQQCRKRLDHDVAAEGRHLGLQHLDPFGGGE